MKNNWLGKLGAGLMTVGAMFAAAFMTGCAEKVSDSGVSEETGISHVTIAGTVQIVGKVIQDSGDQDSSVIGGYVGADPFVPRTIKFCVLDSLTFELSDSCEILDMKGDLSYELEIESTGWRYGLLSVQGNVEEYRGGWDVSYQAVIDRKQPALSNVNFLTTWKYHYVKDLMAYGYSVEEAMAYSEGNILALLGIYGEYAPFGQMNFSGKTRSDAVLVAANFLLPSPTLNPLTSSKAFFDNRLIGRVNLGLRYNFFENEAYWIRMGLDHVDESFADLVERYVANYMSVSYSLGRCVAETEGVVVGPDFFNNDHSGRYMEKADLSLKCEDGLWFWYSPKMEHVIGSMTDSRDGHVYKTTSFTVNGKTQTWMAENLNYELPGSICGVDSLESCEGVGRLYTWPDLMKLDTTGFVWENPNEAWMQGFEDMEECVSDYFVNMWGDLEHDSLIAQKACLGLELNVRELAKTVDSQNHQGICPDGWRVPSVKDWNLLAEYVGPDYSSVRLMKNGAWRLDLVEVPSGGKMWTYSHTSDVIEFSVLEHGNWLASISGSEDTDDRYGLDGNFIVFGEVQAEGRLESVDYFNDKEEIYLSLRCIKAE